MGVLSILTGFLSGGNVIKDIGGILDDVITSKEEKLEIEKQIKEILVRAEQAAQQQVSARWEADMKHGSWLSKNIRPMTLVFLTVIFVIQSFFDGNLGGFNVGEEYAPIYQILLMTVYAAYFAGRSLEKIKKAD